jgi:hypothetical protein
LETLFFPCFYERYFQGFDSLIQIIKIYYLNLE